MIKTHLGFISFWGVKSVSACHVTPHFSREFTNGSSSDATGNNNWRFQAENLRQITIYQLMKPLKIIPHPPVPTVLAAALLKRALAALRGAAPAWLTTSLRSRYIPEDSSRENTNSDTDSKWSWNNSQNMMWKSCHNNTWEWFQRKSKQLYLPSVECTWASVMRNQHKVCRFHREHAMVFGADGLWQVCVVTKRLWLKKSKPAGFRDAHHWSSHLWRRPQETFGSELKHIPHVNCAHRGSHVSMTAYMFHRRNVKIPKLWKSTNTGNPLK